LKKILKRKKPLSLLLRLLTMIVQRIANNVRIIPIVQFAKATEKVKIATVRKALIMMINLNAQPAMNTVKNVQAID
jgi:hypothetical protein